MDERKRLYKSRNNKMICGVCAGIADYFNIDPSIVRVLWAAVPACSPILPARSSCPRATPRSDRLTIRAKKIY